MLKIKTIVMVHVSTKKEGGIDEGTEEAWFIGAYFAKHYSH